MKINRRHALITGTALALGMARPESSVVVANPVAQNLTELVARQSAACANLRAHCRLADRTSRRSLAAVQDATVDCREICAATETILKTRETLPPALLQACADACQRQLTLLPQLTDTTLRRDCEQAARDCANACRIAIG